MIERNFLKNKAARVLAKYKNLKARIISKYDRIQNKLSSKYSVFKKNNASSSYLEREEEVMETNILYNSEDSKSNVESIESLISQDNKDQINLNNSKTRHEKVDVANIANIKSQLIKIIVENGIIVEKTYLDNNGELISVKIK